MTQNPTKKLLAILALYLPLFVIVSPAHAEQTIRWSISAEQWVIGTTGEITVQVSTTGKTVEEASAEAYGAVEALRKATNWDWQSLGRGGNFGEGRSGLSEWVLEAHTRAPIQDLQSVAQITKDLSIPGRRVAIINTDASPSLAEREAGQETLRASMIKQAEAQAKALKASVSSIDFAPGVTPMPSSQPPVMRAMRAETVADGGAPRSGAVRIIETAIVEAVRQ